MPVLLLLDMSYSSVFPFLSLRTHTVNTHLFFLLFLPPTFSFHLPSLLSLPSLFPFLLHISRTSSFCSSSHLFISALLSLPFVFPSFSLSLHDFSLPHSLYLFLFFSFAFGTFHTHLALFQFLAAYVHYIIYNSKVNNHLPLSPCPAIPPPPPLRLPLAGSL